jgi:hypothetical protein
VFRRGATTLTIAVVSGLLLSTLTSPALAAVGDDPADPASPTTAVETPPATPAEETAPAEPTKDAPPSEPTEEAPPAEPSEEAPPAEPTEKATPSAPVEIAPAPDAEDAVRERVIVPLDAESTFALDPANSRPVASGGGATGTVRLAFPRGLSANRLGGYVQVFHAGVAPVGERWIGRVDVAATWDTVASETVFELPEGEYEFFFAGFTSRDAAVWSWLGGGYDAGAARVATISAGQSLSIDMAVDGTASESGRVNITDRNGDGHPEASVTVYAVVDRDGRDELMAVSTQSGWDDVVMLRSARYTGRVAGFDRFAETWLGGVPNIENATVYAAANGLYVYITPIETPAMGVPVILGTAALGQYLRADHAMPRYGVYTYRWYADGTQIPGRASQSLRITSSLVGKRISYRVGVSGPGMLPTSATSLATPRVSTYGSPRVTGWMLPGETMTLSLGTWPRGTTIHYQWRSHGFPIPGATKTTLVVPADGMNSIDALVTATRPGYETVAVLVDRTVGSYPWRLRPVSAFRSQFPAGQQPGSIRGHIRTRVPGGTSVVGATVQVYSAGTGLGAASLRLVKKVKTDYEGKYRVDGLAPGNYCVWVDPPTNRRLERLHYDCRNSLGTLYEGVRVFAGAISEVDEVLEPGETITGTVTSSTGAKVKGATVSVYVPVITTAGHRSMFKIASTTTGSTGRYSLSGLNGDFYYVQFTGPNSSYTSQWWSGKPSPRTAQSVEVDPNKSATANARLAVR